MNASLAEARPSQELSSSGVATEAAATASPKEPLPAPLRPVAVPTVVGGVQAGAALTDRVRAAAGFAISEVRYRLRRLGTATVLGVAAALAAVTLYFTSNLPQSAVVATLNSQLARQTSLPKGTALAVPAGAILASLPARAEAPNVVAKILEEAQAAGIELPRGQYEYVPARDGVAARYRMTFPVHATYPKIRAFMDRTLVALPAVAVEGLRIERKNVGDDSVEAELKLAAYVRSDP